MGGGPVRSTPSAIPSREGRSVLPSRQQKKAADLAGMREVSVEREIPPRTPQPIAKEHSQAKLPHLKPQRAPKNILERIVQHMGIFPRRSAQGKVLSQKSPPLRKIPPRDTSLFIPLRTKAPTERSVTAAKVDEKVSQVGPSAVLFPPESDPSPFRGPSQVQEDRGPTNWGNGQFKKVKFSGQSTINLGHGETASEELLGVETKDIAQKMLIRNAARADSLGLLKPVGLFLSRAQEWVQTTAFRQSAEVRSISEIAVTETTNHQVHRVKGKEGTVLCFEQFGGLSDNGNSYVSLKTLKELAGNPFKQRTFVRSLQASLASAHSEKEKGVIRRAIEEVQNPEEALKRRRFLLEQQMLIVVYNRLQTAAESKTIQERALHLSHLSLLNPNLKKTEEASGIRHDESTMIDDMSEIFRDFDGKKICFDDTDAPYVEDGVIHMPQALGNQELTLHTHYGNVSTQGSRSPEGDRQMDACNVQMILEMKKSLNALLQKNPPEPRKTELILAQGLLSKCTEDLQAHRQSFQLAADLLEVQIVLGWQVSTGCYSNKDRGGVVGAMVCTNHLAFKKTVDWRMALKRGQPKPEWEEQARSLRRQEGLRALERGSLQRQAAAYNNSGQTALKVDVIHDVRSPRGALIAIKNGAQVGKDLVMSQIRAFLQRTRTSIF